MILKKNSALIVGATGLVGQQLLQILLKGEQYESVVAIVRRSLEIKNPKLWEIVCDFDNLEEIQDKVAGIDDVFCCLGTTIKKAKTKETMHKVDVEYPLEVAKLALNKGAKHFLLISSMSADSNSLFFYPRIKGKLEEELKSYSFEAISIFRPSLLLGGREEFRLGEKMAETIYKVISPIIKTSWKSRLAIKAKTVARAMYEVAKQEEKGIAIYEAPMIEERAATCHVP